MNESLVQSQTSMNVMDKNASGKLRSRMTMVGLFLAFFGPIFIAIFMYSRLDLWQPTPSYNHGELLMPVKPLAMLELTDRQGTPVNLQTIEGRWFYIYIGRGACGLECEASLFKIRQLRALLGRDLQRVQYLYAAMDEAAENSVSGLGSEHPRMMSGRVASGSLQPQLDAFGKNPEGKIFLIDPNGNLVLRYGADAKSRGMMKDIRRLLKVSKIG